MSDLLLMSPPGLPRNGLIALWDPYRDAYGLNVGSGANFSGIVSPAWGVTNVTLTESGTAPSGGRATKIAHTATTSSHGVFTGGSDRPAVVGATLWFSICVKPVECGFVRLSLDSQYANFNLTTGAVASVSGTPPLAYGIIPLADGWFRCYIAKVLSGSTITAIDVYKANWAELGVAGEGILAGDACFNLGPVLFPYSAPAGAPGTLQTSLDYSGNGNNLTLGATTGASTDDPAFTGTAWSFDGGDYMFKETPAGLSGCTGMTMIHVVSFPELVEWAVPLAMGRGGAPEPMYTMFGAAGEMYSQAKASGGNVGEYWGFTPSIDTTYMLTTIYSPSDGLLNFVGVTPKTGFSANGSLSWSGFTAKLVVGMSSAITNGSKQSTNLVAVHNRPITLMELNRTYYHLKGLMAKRGVTLA